MDFTAGRRETICEVCPGDLVQVRLVHRDGTLTPDAESRLPYLIYKPYFAGEDISARRRHHLHGADSSPEWHVDIGSLWAPLPGFVAIAGGSGTARFQVFYTLQHCGPNPGLSLTLTFFRLDMAIPRPRGAQDVRVGNNATVRLSAGEHQIDVPMQPSARSYPLSFATTIQPMNLTSLIFGIVL